MSVILDKIESRDAFAVIQDINATAIGDMVEAVKLWNDVNGTRFDGIVVPTETVVFEPNQIKSATDNIGTYSKFEEDIQFSEKMQVDLYDLFDESDRRKADKAEILEDLKRFEEYIKLEKKYAHSKHIDPKTLSMVTKWLREKADTKYAIDDVKADLADIYNYIIADDVTTDGIFERISYFYYFKFYVIFNSYYAVRAPVYGRRADSSGVKQPYIPVSFNTSRVCVAEKHDIASFVFCFFSYKIKVLFYTVFMTVADQKTLSIHINNFFFRIFVLGVITIAVSYHCYKRGYTDYRIKITRVCTMVTEMYDVIVRAFVFV